MTSFTFLYAVALTLFVASASPMMASPEPEIDPMGGPGLYLVPAGTSMSPMKALRTFNKICPADYPSGFSILCHAGGPSDHARFFVNGKLFKTEYREPFYIAGDYNGRVRPWKDYPKNFAIIRCKLSRRTNVFAKIKFAC